MVKYIKLKGCKTKRNTNCQSWLTTKSLSLKRFYGTELKDLTTKSRAPWSCGLMQYVLDWEVGGSNPGKSVSFSPGRRLDLTCLFFWTRRIKAEWSINGEKKEWIWIINFKWRHLTIFVARLISFEILKKQTLDGHKWRQSTMDCPPLKKRLNYKSESMYFSKDLQFFSKTVLSQFLYFKIFFKYTPSNVLF